MKKDLKVWKKVSLGVPLSWSQLGPFLCPCAASMFNSRAYSIAGKEREINLVRIPLTELDFQGSVSYKDVPLRAEENGLMICPAEVGPRLRVEYTDQPIGDSVHIGMRGMLDFEGNSNHFKVAHSTSGKGQLILATGARLASFCQSTEEWVFILPDEVDINLMKHSAMNM